jgi:hypothetical protein
MIHPTTGMVTAANGNFTVRATATDSCSTSVTDMVVSVYPIPPAPVITLNGTLLSSNASSGNQWYEVGGPVSGATNQTFTPTANGSYYCVVTLNGCSSDPSDTLTVIVTSTEQLTESPAFSIFPNPGNGVFTLRFDSPVLLDVTMDIWNDVGQIVYKYIITADVGKLFETIDLSFLPKGIYIIRTTSGDKINTIKLVMK